MLWDVPARRRPKTPAAPPLDPIAQFSAGLLAAAEKERVAQEQKQLAEETARAEAQRAEEHAAAVVSAQRELQDAIDGVRAAKRAGRGTVEANARWRAAKARVIELETGAPPSWATDRSAAPEPSTDDVVDEHHAQSEPATD